MQQDMAPDGESFLISFIITYYNIPPDMLRRCVRSILALNLQPCEREIILVDDGSPISPMDIVEEYRSDIRYIHQPNQGPAVARNAGLDAAKGTYIQYVDADDYLLKKGFEYCLQWVRQHPELDIVTLDYTQDRARNCNFTHTPAMSGEEYMLHYNLYGADWAYLFRRSTMSGLRFSPGIIHEDEEFIPQMMLRAQWVMGTTACAYFYQRREGSIINNEEEAHQQKRLHDFETVIDNLHAMAQGLLQKSRQALMRRVNQLTMDHLYNVIQLTRNWNTLETTVKRLSEKGLFPLPDKRYTLKYMLFCRLSATRTGRRILFFIISQHRRP